MKKFLFIVLSALASISAYAQESAPTAEVASYTYGMHLDIANVLNVTEAANVCASTPVQMTYKDSQGETHILEYSVMGTGCTN